MAGSNWNDLGRDLNRIIDDAVHMGNYGRLNESINTVLNKAFGGMGTSGAPGGDSGWDFNLSKNASDNSAPGGHSYSAPRGNYYTPRQTAPYSKTLSPYFAGSGRRKGGSIGILVGGIVLISLGAVLMLTSLLSLLITFGNIGLSLTGLGALMLIAGIIMTVKGSSGLKLAKAFDRYVQLLDGETYGDIKMLSAYTHKPEDVVVRDLKKMIRRGWFLQGHLDQAESCLMVSHETYEQYINTVKNARMQQEEAQRRSKEAAAKEGLSPEAKAVIDEGHEYIKKIKASNDAIPGEEISNKIYKMELLVRRIFDQAEAHPENISDLRRLMEYYLPMTVKLLGAYEELDKQPIQGDNISASKKEIEDTLDTLNVAFEKLLDNLFRDTAWDVSSDISVLQTMLAQEGLTKDDFTK